MKKSELQHVTYFGLCLQQYTHAKEVLALDSRNYHAGLIRISKPEKNY